jgi:sugar phosphate isomerase/epimerase
LQLVLSGTEIAVGQGVDPLVTAAQRLGIGWVELWYPRNSEKLGLIPTLARLARAGIRVACVGTATELGGDGDTSAAQHTIIEAIRIAADLGCGMVNTYFGWPGFLDDRRSTEIYRRNLEPCLRAAEQAGIILTLENEFDGFGCDPLGTDLTRRPESLAALMDAVGSEHFRVTFDPCNAYFAGLDPGDAYDQLAPYITYVHLKDGMAAGGALRTSAGWRQFTDHGRHYVTCPLGVGGVGWPSLFSRLRRDGYAGFLSLEPHCEPERLPAAWEQAARTVRDAVAS